MKFRKKPVVIDAYQFNPAERADYISVLGFADNSTGIDNRWGIRTLEGIHEITIGDWIITGVKGEHYACKPDIFKLTYEPVGDAL